MLPDRPSAGTPAPKLRYRFGLFDVNPADGSLTRQGKHVKLQEQPFKLLVLMLERPSEVVLREEIRQRLWPSDTFVDFDKSLGVAVTKLRDALGDEAGNPRFIETLPRRGYRFVAQVERYEGGAADNSAATSSVIPKMEIDSAPVPVVPIATNGSTTSATKSRYFAGLILLALFLIAAFVSMRHFRLTRALSASKPEAIVPIAPAKIRRSVAVLGFRNLPGRVQDDWLSAAFSEMLNTELAAGGSIRLVAGEDIARAKRDVPIANEETLAKSTLTRLRTDPGADLIVLGSYAAIPKDGKNRIRLDIRVQDTATGETISEDSLTGTEDALFELASQAGSHLRQSLGVASISSGDSEGVRTALPVNENAVRFYSEGRAKLFNYDFFEARDLLTKAIAADPNYPLAHAALSEALWHLGYLVKARATAQRAMELSGHLPEEDRLLVEGGYRRAIADWPKAVATYRTLFQRFPDRLDYGLLLASAQVQAGSPDALQTLATLRKLPAPAGDDPRIDAVEASAWMNSDLVKARAAAESAISKSTAQNSPSLVSFAEGLMCQLATGTRSSTEDGARICEHAMQNALAVGDRDGEAMALNNLAALHYAMGDVSGSEKMFLKNIQNFHEIGNPDGVATAQLNLAAALISRGELISARKYLRDALPNFRAVDDSVGVALAFNNLGDSYYQAGDLEAAKSNYDQALLIAKEKQDKDSTAYVFSGLGDVLYDRGDLAGARKSYEQALALRQAMGEKESTAQSQVSLAQLAIEEGNPAAAESALRKCLEQFHAERQTDDELSAGIALASALLAQQKSSEAQQALDRIKSMEGASQNRLLRLQFALTSARTLLASDKFKTAAAPLQQLLRDARQSGSLGLELETRLALAELAKKSGHTASAQAQFAALKAAATAKGFGRIARKAAAAQS
jgi:DNA-binding winged helix-turn-helix (wHTH) protein/tetratricopeptide (TPR) repeat protein